MNWGILEDYLGTTWRLLEDYYRTIRKQPGGFLRPTCWSFWCNLGHLVTAFLLSLAQLGPLDEYLMTSSKLLLSEQTYSPSGQQRLFFFRCLLHLWFEDLINREKILHVREAIVSEKCSFFEHCSKGLWPPPPFIWTFVLFCRGCFLNAFLSIWYNVPILPPNFTINASNVGVRKAPCKKSFGILASNWTPPKIK